MRILGGDKKGSFRGWMRIGAYYHRYYDPKTGRYLTPDPLNLGIVQIARQNFQNAFASVLIYPYGLRHPQLLNLYLYVINSPVNWIDPPGLIQWSTVGKGAASAFIGVVGIAWAAAMAGTPTGVGQVLGATAALAGSSSLAYGVGQIIAGLLDEEIPFMGPKEALIKGTIPPGPKQENLLALDQIVNMLPDITSGRLNVPPSKIMVI